MISSAELSSSVPSNARIFPLSTKMASFPSSEFTETEIKNCTFDSNGVDVIEGYPTYGGAIFSDMSTLNITDSRFFNNVAGDGNAIYAYDSSFNIKGSTFKNNTNAIFSVFPYVNEPYAGQSQVVRPDRRP